MFFSPYQEFENNIIYINIVYIIYTTYNVDLRLTLLLYGHTRCTWNPQKTEISDQCRGCR